MRRTRSAARHKQTMLPFSIPASTRSHPCAAAESNREKAGDQQDKTQPTTQPVFVVQRCSIARKTMMDSRGNGSSDRARTWRA
jgi:hypothetical protein